MNTCSLINITSLFLTLIGQFHFDAVVSAATGVTNCDPGGSRHYSVNGSDHPLRNSSILILPDCFFPCEWVGRGGWARGQSSKNAKILRLQNFSLYCIHWVFIIIISTHARHDRLLRDIIGERGRTQLNHIRLLSAGPYTMTHAFNEVVPKFNVTRDVRVSSPGIATSSSSSSVWSPTCQCAR